MSEKYDINTVPYEAPLAFKEPSNFWLRRKAHAGTNRTHIKPPAADLTGKWVVITGSNNGIGREAALQFAAWGANLVLGCRNPPPHETHPEHVVQECLQRAREHGKTITCEWWEVNYTDLASVEAFGKRVVADGRPLDILADNAGMGASPGGSEVLLTKDGFEIIHQVNFTAHVLLELTVLPALKKAKEPRIIGTTSCFHYYGRSDLGNWNGEKGDPGLNGVHYYQNSKLAYQVWLTELQHRLLQLPEYRHITVNGVHPGYVNSGIWKMSEGLWLKEYALFFFSWLLGITSQQGSMCILYAATDDEAGPNPALQGVGKPNGKGGGRYFNRIWPDESMPHCHDPDYRLRVWRKVNDELGLEQKGLLKDLGLKYVAPKASL